MSHRPQHGLKTTKLIIRIKAISVHINMLGPLCYKYMTLDKYLIHFKIF